jgi:hypothetical protein
MEVTAMDWNEFDLDRTETVLMQTARRLIHMAPTNHGYATLKNDYLELETAVDMYYRFADLELNLLAE